MGQLREVRHNHYNLPPEHATDFKAYQNDQILIYNTYNDIQKSEHKLSNNTSSPIWRYLVIILKTTLYYHSYI